MAYLQWLQEDVRACCPLCGEEGPKGAVLATDHVLPGHPRITLLRCPACGAAFLQDLTPPDYEVSLAVQLDYYVEQGAGIDCIVAPLLRLPPESVRRCLDVGCSFGFALDFSRYAFGWEVLGVDPSPLATAGAEALDLPIHRCYFNSDLDLGPEPFDLILCSEILEHLAEPHALFVAMRERLSPEGLLVLSTPNSDIVRKETEEGVLGRALSPGFHLVLYDRGSLALFLAKAGFSEVRIEESPETLRAFAACSPAALARMRPAEPAPGRTLLRDYFAARAASAPPGSSLACGFAWRHFKECVNAGLHEEAAASRAVLAGIYRERFGLDLLDPEKATEVEAEARLRRRPLPFNLTGALFLSGILELNGFGRPDRAADCFAAAIAAGSALLDEQRPTGLCDGETEAFTVLSRKHLPMALAATGLNRAVREVETVASLAPAAQGGRWSMKASLSRLFRRRRSIHRRPMRGRLIIAERFVAPCAGLSAIVLPLDVIARQPVTRLRLLVFAADGEPAQRVGTLLHPRLSPEEALRLVFAPFDAPAGASFFLAVLDLSAEEDGAPLPADLESIRAAAAGRSPIVLECLGGGAADLLTDERGIAVFRATPGASPAPAAPAVPEVPAGHPEIRTAHGLDAFWCDPHGLYLRGWIHAHEHRVRGLRIESAGRSARIETFSDRPDLVAFFPEHEHVRHGGFAIYLACPPGHPVSLTLETDGGMTSFPLPLPEGPLPPWPKSSEEEEVSPMMRRFAELANALGGRGGRLLQIGARTPRGTEVVPSRRLLEGRVIGIDIHPGLNVDVVGDAHGLSRFLRAGSVDAVLSASVLEHLQAPWLLAAEINRVLKPGGLVYHQVPGAWPAHAQPNDFWRFSAEGLRVLFGPDCGFEVLEACDSGPAALIPSPEWRRDYLDMPTVPAYTVAEILARKVAEVQPGAVAWPLGAGASETRSRRYPVSGLRPPSPRGRS